MRLTPEADRRVGHTRTESHPSTEQAGSQAVEAQQTELTNLTEDEGLANEVESEEDTEAPQQPELDVRTSGRARTPSARTTSARTATAEPTAAKAKAAKATGVKRAAPAANTSPARRGQRRRNHA